MTPPPHGPADLRRLLTEARAVVAAFDELVSIAGNDRDRSWAQRMGRSAHETWDWLLDAARAADARKFISLVRDVIGIAVPLDDAPEGLWDPSREVTHRLDVLAGDYQRTFWPMLMPPDNHYPPGVLAEISAALHQVAAEFDDQRPTA
ncbi:MAG TPA: hypothetical protein VIG48_10675 [Jatrophihabitans sp.]